MRQIGIGATIILLASTAPALAQEGMNWIGLDAAQWETEDEDDDVGFGLSLRFGIGERFSLRLGAVYFDDVATSDGADTEIRVLRAEATLLLDLTDPYRAASAQIYIGGGVGGYFFDADADVAPFDYDIDNDVGYHVVGGIRLRMGPTANLVLEGGYAWFDGTERLENGATITDDIDLSGPIFRAGLEFLM